MTAIATFKDIPHLSEDEFELVSDDSHGAPFEDDEPTPVFRPSEIRPVVSIHPIEVPRLTGKDPRSGLLSENAELMLWLVDGTATALEIVMASPVSEDETLGALRELYWSGVIAFA